MLNISVELTRECGLVKPDPTTRYLIVCGKCKDKVYVTDSETRICKACKNLEEKLSWNSVPVSVANSQHKGQQNKNQVPGKHSGTHGNQSKSNNSTNPSNSNSGKKRY
jgi:hypothetical protein